MVNDHRSVLHRSMKNTTFACNHTGIASTRCLIKLHTTVGVFFFRGKRRDGYYTRRLALTPSQVYVSRTPSISRSPPPLVRTTHNAARVTYNIRILYGSDKCILAPADDDVRDYVRAPLLQRARTPNAFFPLLIYIFYFSSFSALRVPRRASTTTHTRRRRPAVTLTRTRRRSLTLVQSTSYEFVLDLIRI